MSKQRNDTIPTIRRLFDSCCNGKTLQFFTWNIPTVHTIALRIFPAVLKEDIHSFDAEPFRKAFYSPWISRGLVIAYGQEWTLSWAILRPLLQESPVCGYPTSCTFDNSIS